MTQPRRILLFAVLALLLAAAGWHLYATREPSYQGKTLSQWLEDSLRERFDAQTDSTAAREAIRAIGHKGIATLLRMLQAEDSPLKLKVKEWLEECPIVDFTFKPAYKSQNEGIEGFLVLGPEGRDALPALKRLLQNTNYANNAALCLAAIGPEAMPILRSGLSNQSDCIRYFCLCGLEYAGTNAWAALPDILSCLQDSFSGIRFEAVYCLRRFQHEPGTVLPALYQTAQQDPNVPVRKRSIWVMGCFSNQASAYVPALQNMLSSVNTNDTPLCEALTNALKKIDPAAWPNGGGMPPADLPKNLP